jgi:hypothetical protein
MITSITKYLLTPGFLKSKPSDFNPAENIMGILQDQQQLKKNLTQETSKKDKVKFENVGRAKAALLYSDEMILLNISATQQNSQYHSHVSKGFIFILLGIFLMSLPIIGLFFDLGIRIPILSSFLPIFGYGVFISMVPSIGILLLIGVRHWYFAKMITLKQKFPFTQYFSSLRLLPTNSQVIK